MCVLTLIKARPGKAFFHRYINLIQNSLRVRKTAILDTFQSQSQENIFPLSSVLSVQDFDTYSVPSLITLILMTYLMDNISKMVLPESNPAAPVPGCYFLEELPVELRLSVYEYFFEGSKVHAAIFKNADPPSNQSSAIKLRHSEHFKLLLSCRKIYNEALKTYWSKTVLKLHCPPLKFRRPSEFRPAKLKLDEYAHRLCTSLPEQVKANVRHIRGMVLPALKSAFVEGNPSFTASAILGTFKKLATCEMSPTLAHPVDGIVSHTKDPKNKGFSRFKMTWGEEPVHFLAERYGIDAAAGITFLFKGAIMFSMARGEANMSISLKQSLVC